MARARTGGTWSRIGLLAALTLVAPDLAGCAGQNQALDGKRKSDKQPSADKYYKVALGSFHNGMLEDAKIQLGRALDADDAHPESHYLLGVIYLAEGKAMIDALEGEICLTDEAAELQHMRADELHRKAHDEFERAAGMFEEDASGRGRALNSMSVVSLYFGDHDTAIEESRKALEVQFYGERYSALANLGWAYYGRGDMVEAMTELREALMMNPEYCVGQYRLAQVYLDYDLHDKAAEVVAQVLENDRCPIQDARRIAGVAQMHMGYVAEANASFTECVTMAPRSCLADKCRHYQRLAAKQVASGGAAR